MDENPGISVVICTWNRADLLDRTLQSLRQQRGVATSQIEVLVIDNNSVDATKEVAERQATDWPLGSLRHVFEPRQGKQFALNRAIEVARWPVLAFTDDDILFPKDWLQQVQLIFSDRGVMLAGGRTLADWSQARRPAWYGDDLGAVLGHVDLGDARLDPAPTGFTPGGANLVARAELFARIGRFAEDHFRHMDHELGTRAHARGERVVYDPRLVVMAPVDASCLTPRYFRRWYFKAGIGRLGGAQAVGDRWPSVPGWIYRQLLEDLLASCWPPGESRAAMRFSREMRAWRHWGTIANAWHAWLRPASHPAWVQGRSQKRGNVY